jgi:signal transduction histidine kinase
MAYIFWQRINRVLTVGVDKTHSPGLSAVVQLTNACSLLTSGAFLILLPFVHLFFNQWEFDALVLAGAIGFTFPIFFNYFGWYNLSRLFYGLLLPTIFIAGSILKLSIAGSHEFVYWYVYKLPLVAAAIMPFTIFMRREREKWLFVVLINIHVLLFYNQIICWSLGLSMAESPVAKNGLYFDMVALLSYTAISVIAFLVRGSIERYVRDKKHLIARLETAQQTITEQKEALAGKNVELIHKLQQNQSELETINKELLGRQNELLQFSYTISHNLRGPVAGLIGLNNLIDKDKLDDENKELIQHMMQLNHTIDNTINDLNHVIKTRHSISEIKQPVSVTGEIASVCTLLNEQIVAAKVELKLEVECDWLFTVKSAVQSILYNLISNAIKYRKADNACEVRVRTFLDDNSPVIEVSDNGIGMDLPMIKNKLFGIYQRFHHESEGKGMGLFLVKMQVELLGGSIHIESAPGNGSTFTIAFPPSALIASNRILDSSFFCTYYLPEYETSVVQWKRNPSTDEIIEAYMAFKEVMIKYPTRIIVSEHADAMFTEDVRNAIRAQLAPRIDALRLTHYCMVIPKKIQAGLDTLKFRQNFEATYAVPLEIFETLAESITFARQMAEQAEQVQA